MILVTGGRYNGKKDWVIENLGFKKEDFSDDIFDEKAVLFSLESIAFENNEATIKALLRKKVIICSEIGSGIVPIEKKDRSRQEMVGRMCIFLAKNATEVYRIFNGIGMKIK